MSVRKDVMQPLTGPREFVLVRHAESRGNVANQAAHDRAANQLDLEVRDADMPLSDLGVRQARALGEHLDGLPAERRPTRIFSSPYTRALDTARAAAGRTDLPVEVDERLRERELGVLDGVTASGIQHLHPDEAARREWLGKFYYRPPSGESWCDVLHRVRQFLIQLSMAELDGGCVLGLQPPGGDPLLPGRLRGPEREGGAGHRRVHPAGQLLDDPVHLWPLGRLVAGGLR
jgi:broad specificity phosphatase PhoE